MSDQRPYTGLDELSYEQVHEGFVHHLKEMCNFAVEMQWRDHGPLSANRLVGMITLFVVDIIKLALGIEGSAARIEEKNE